MTEIQQNAPEMGKRIWHLVRVVFFMLRKGVISKRKLTVELNLILKRGKLAGKALGNLLTFHHHHGHAAGDRRLVDYEFSCSNSPAAKSFPSSFYFLPGSRRRQGSGFSKRSHAPPTSSDHEFATVNAVKRVLEMLNTAETASPGFAFGQSPGLPGYGFGQSPVIGGGRQLRITDSPFPLGDASGDCHVDEAAEEFIQRFYKELQQQSNLN